MFNNARGEHTATAGGPNMIVESPTFDFAP